MPRRSIILTVTNDLTYDQRMHRICNSLAAANYKVKLVGRALPFSKPTDAFAFEQFRLKCRVNKGKLFYIEYNIRLFIYLLFSKADIICGIDLDTIMPCYFAARLKGAKIVYDAHEYFPEVPEVIRRPLVQKIWRRVESFFTPRVDLVYTTTQSIANLFEEKYKRAVYVIRNVPLLQMDSSFTVHEKQYLLYQGALNEGRGLEQLICAMQGIDSVLYIVGDGDIANQLKMQVNQLGLGRKIEFLGYKKPADLRQITSGAYIGLNLLEAKGLSYYYSLANKFLDYIHAGVPQVCIDFPEYKRINNNYEVALLIENMEIDTIKSAINRLLIDEKKYNDLRENCLVCRKELNWQNEEKKLIALYDQLD